MSVELTGQVAEEFETRTTPLGFELMGTGALRSLHLEFGDGWGQPVPLPDGVGAQLEHEIGILGRIVVRSGQRVRVEVTMESLLDEMVSVPGPVMRFEGAHRPIPWLAGASGEVVFPSETGPGLLTQRRGLATPGPEDGTAYIFEFQPWLRPRQLLSSAWTYETYPGDLLDLPVEASWLPWARYVPLGEEVLIHAPDGMVSAGPKVEVAEEEGEFTLVPHGGPSQAEVWSAAGSTTIEIGAFGTVVELRDGVRASAEGSGAACYLAARHLSDTWLDEAALDELDRVLGRAVERPTAWTACAAAVATQLGLPLESDAREAATRVLANPTADDVILLAMHGLAPVSLASGEWPVGDFGRLGMEAVQAIGYGRITSDAKPPRGRDVAVAKLFAAALGESERGLRVASYAQASENRLLTHLTGQVSVEDLAWLSIQEPQG